VSPSIGVKKHQQQRGRSFANPTKDNFTPRVVTFDLTPRRTRLLTWGARRFGMASSLSCQPSPLCQGRGCYARCAAWKVRRNIGVIEFSVAFLCSGRSAPVGDDAVCGACALLARSLPPLPKRWCLLLAARGGCRQWRRYAAASCSRSMAHSRGEPVRAQTGGKAADLSLFEIVRCWVEKRGSCIRLAGCSPSLLGVVGICRTHGVAAGRVLSALVRAVRERSCCTARPCWRNGRRHVCVRLHHDDSSRTTEAPTYVAVL